MKIKYAKANNVKDYIALPREQREVLGFWYLTPESFLVGGGSFDDYWKENYPIQYRIREFFYDIGIWWSVKKRQFYEKIWVNIFPQNKWARKVIPNHWSDKPELIKDFLFASIVHFVERENEEPIVDWNHDERHRKVWKEINECYDFITKELPARERSYEEQLDELYSDKVVDQGTGKERVRNWIADGFEDIDKDKQQSLWDFEKKMEEKTQEVLKKIIDVRIHLWT